MTLFPNFIRDDPAPRRAKETPFEFYNRSSSSQSAARRSWLEAQLSHWPSGELPDMINRLRRDAQTHYAALFECAVAEHLRRAGASIAHHPKVSKARGRPDFLVKDWPAFLGGAVVECVTANPSQHGQNKSAQDAMTDAIATKAQKYGRLSLPLIIAFADLRVLPALDAAPDDIWQAASLASRPDFPTVAGIWVFR